MERNKRIFMVSWLQCHSRTKVTSSDGWYLNFVNRLFPLIEASDLYMDKETKEVQEAALFLTLYLEDCVADEGGWRRFIELYSKRYGNFLPFYKLPDDYMSDEINEADVAFVLWKLNCDEDAIAGVINPLDKDLLTLAHDIYEFILPAFEQAPICDIPSGDWVLPSEQLLVDRMSVQELKPEMELPESVTTFLKGSGGEQLMYFPRYEHMQDFFVRHLSWKPAEVSDVLNSEACNIVVFANPKGILIAPAVSWFFCDDRNKETYDAVIAREEGYQIFTDKGYCPFDLLKYGVEHNLFPEARFPFENGKDLLRDNWDFIARWFLGEYYEGK